MIDYTGTVEGIVLWIGVYLTKNQHSVQDFTFFYYYIYIFFIFQSSSKTVAFFVLHSRHSHAQFRIQKVYCFNHNLK